MRPAPPARAWEAYAPRRLLFGPHTLEQIGAEALALGAGRALVVTTAGMTSRATYGLVMESLREAGLTVHAWPSVVPEPGIEVVEAAVLAARAYAPDVVIGLGGGSAMDTAKLTAALLTNAVPVASVLGRDRIERPGVPTILVPTTAGSGSEVSHEAVVTDRRAGTKHAAKTAQLVSMTTIIDPRSTVTCPPDLTSSAGMDALTHALEALTALHANELSDVYALEAIKLIFGALPRAVAQGEDLAARSSMALGAMMAGHAFASTGTAAVHACGYPLSGLYGIPHGVANAVMLPHVIQFNRPATAKYGAAEAILGGDLGPRLADLMAAIRIPTRLRDLGVPEGELRKNAAIAARDERHLSVNPRPVSEADLVDLFRRAW